MARNFACPYSGGVCQHPSCTRNHCVPQRAADIATPRTPLTRFEVDFQQEALELARVVIEHEGVYPSEELVKTVAKRKQFQQMAKSMAEKKIRPRELFSLPFAKES